MVGSWEHHHQIITPAFSTAEAQRVTVWWFRTLGGPSSSSNWGDIWKVVNGDLPKWMVIGDPMNMDDLKVPPILGNLHIMATK